MTSVNIVPISRERHGAKSFRRFASYHFAAAETVIPIIGGEIPRASVSFPIAFIRQGDAVVLVAVMGLEPGSNLFVAPDGRWIGPYIPAAFRAHPFLLAHTSDQRQVLCINEASGLVVDDQTGEPFFDEEGQPSSAIQSILDFLNQVHANRLATEQACRVIAKHDILEPWTIVSQGEEGPRNVTGLWRINEQKLGRLPDEGFLELRHSGALVLIYSQLMSMGHLPALERLAGMKAQMNRQAKAPVPETLDGLFGVTGSGEIDIDWSKFKT